MSGFVAALRLFLVYGLNCRPQLTSSAASQNELGASLGLTAEEPKTKGQGPYRPPHLRNKESLSSKQPKSQDSRISPDHDSTTVYFASSDSDFSDSDGSLKNHDIMRSSKVRVAAISCLQVSSKHQIHFCFVLFPSVLQGFFLKFFTSFK